MGAFFDDPAEETTFERDLAARSVKSPDRNILRLGQLGEVSRRATR
ncbi:MAG: hypothetical protein OXN89_25910 [Bryobacterales bacterium]|nr:hypothetical protein [Bryobacterales bacterium]